MMISGEEFGTRFRRAGKTSQLWALGGMLGGSAWFFGFATAVRAARLNAHPPWSYAVIALWIGIAVLIVVGATQFGQQRARSAGLICPRCNKGLLGVAGMIVVASGHCGY